MKSSNGRLFFCVCILTAGILAFADCSNVAKSAKGNARQQGKGCCGKQHHDLQSPRSELNPPDDIATLPEYEALRFAKIFNEVPQPIKQRAVKDYVQRIKYKESQPYRMLIGRLGESLRRSQKRLAADPGVSVDDVLKMCDDILVYGRSLTMGRMGGCSFVELARQYGFKNARQTLERLENTRNFTSGLALGYPRDDPEHRDFEKLAMAANREQWESFLLRVKDLTNRHNARKSGVGAAPGEMRKERFYGEFDVEVSGELPADVRTLPKHALERVAKMYDLLPSQIKAYAMRDYEKRIMYLGSESYADVKRKLARSLATQANKLAKEPTVSAKNVMRLCDEVVRYGRPCVFGDMRDVSLVELAKRHGYANVEKLMETVEDEKYLARKVPLEYPLARGEFADFARMAKAANRKRWEEFLDRLAMPGRK